MTTSDRIPDAPQPERITDARAWELAEWFEHGLTDEEIAVAEVRPGPGRPALPEDERRDLTVQVRVTKLERALIDAAAQEAGLSRSDWLRKVAHDAAVGA